MGLKNGSKSPTGSGFSGLVRVEDVWDYKKENLMRSEAVTILIANALSLGYEHTVDTLIRYHQTEFRELKSNGAIIGSLRSKIEKSIKIAQLSKGKKQKLLSILDLKPKAGKRHFERDKREFLGGMELFVTEEEVDKLRSVVHQESGVEADRISFSGPLYIEDARFCEAKVEGKTLQCSITEKNSKNITKVSISFCHDEHQHGNMLILFRKKLFRR